MNHCQVPALVKFTLLLFVLLLLVTACHRHADSADEQIRRQLPGIWTFDARYADGNEALCWVTVAPDGSYSSTITLPHRTNGPRVINMEGTFRVEDGFLIDTVTNDSQTNASVLPTFRSRILRANDHELTLEDEKIPGVVFMRQTRLFFGNRQDDT